MSIINFKEFKILKDITRKQSVIGDARESVANMLYLNTNGVRAHTLAFKIYKSEGDTEYDEQEVKLITDVAKLYATPAFIDGIYDIIHPKHLN